MRQVLEMELPRQLEELMMTFWNTVKVDTSVNGQALLDEGFSGAGLGVELERRVEIEFQGMLERPERVI